MSQNTYTILQDECLSLIAQRFSVSVQDLMKLNSTQIKDPNLIYEGNTLILPLPLPIQVDGSRTPTPVIPAPEEKASDICKNDMPLDDILYIPAHPKTGKKTWYAIDQKVKDLLLEEKKILEESIVDDDMDAIVKNLNNLGILSKFEAKQYEHFMDEEQVEKYRSLLFAQFAINTQACVVDGKNPNEFLLKVAKILDYQLAERFNWLSDWQSHSSVSGYPAMNQEPDLESSPQFINRINNQLRSQLLVLMTKHINELEKKAKKAAGKIDAEDGTKFVFMEKLDYFSTTQQKEIADAIQALNSKSRSERRSGIDLALSSHAECVEYLSAWPEMLEKAWKEGRELSELGRVRRNNKYYYSAENIRILNVNGYAVKEQCLTPKQLIGDSGITLGPEALAKKPWRRKESGAAKPLDINATTLIANLYKEVGGPEFDGKNDQRSIESLVNNTDLDWAYYPTLALIAVIDATIKKHKSALAQVLNTGSTPLDQLFGQLLWIKKVALARIALLKSIAEKKAAAGAKSMQFIFGEEALFPKKFTLLWDESAYKPKEIKISGFSNQAGYNDLQVVECCLLSDGKVFYVRGPQWYMPGDDQRLICQSAGRVQNITSKIAVVDKASQGADLIEANDIPAALKKMADVSIKMELVPLKAEKQFDTAFWQDSYHYQDGIGPNGKGGIFNIDAGAQLLRFSSKAEAELNSPLNSYSDLISKPRNIGGSGGISATFTALQAQLSMSFWLPLQDDSPNAIAQVKPHQLEILYQDKEDKEHPYQAGYLCANIIGNVYGLAAASCQLSAKIAIGPTDVGEGFGIKGSTVGLFDPNVRDGYNLGNASLNDAEKAKIAAEASASVDVFAGVEAGGSLTAAVYWAPPTPPSSKKTIEPNNPAPKVTNLQKLGSVQGSLAAAAGVGAQAEFRLAIQGGILLVIAKAGLVFGPGCQGKTEIVVDTERLDEFLDCLLGVLKKSNFRRLSVFGEADENGVNDDFELLNDILTIATGLGLSASKALLIPFNVWQDYKKEALSKEYAPFLARNINEEDDKRKSEKVRQWVVKLPPETLSNLLTALSQKQYNTRFDGEGRPIRAATDNQNQAAAIVKIMQWLATDVSESDEINQRQWKEALIAMANLPKYSKDYSAEWDGYKQQWFKLAAFIKNTENNKVIIGFTQYSKQLCANMVLTKQKSYTATGIIGGVERYEYATYPTRCVPNASLGQGTLAIVSRQTDLATNRWHLEQTNEIIINWSLDEIIF
ncbi:LysM peptidoglycan-binding domain-containing protein [Vibrio sp. N418]|uniref:LysM peptidoglycan-binding domain-containing protein n=1 Tax=Vibrio sp. (strain N418) TaxID=701176 RepID=UPI0002FA50AE|nr:LysM domain-containing protein [Vibrio sp. N418]